MASLGDGGDDDGSDGGSVGSTTDESGDDAASGGAGGEGDGEEKSEGKTEHQVDVGGVPHTPEDMHVYAALRGVCQRCVRWVEDAAPFRPAAAVAASRSAVSVLAGRTPAPPAPPTPGTAPADVALFKAVVLGAHQSGKSSLVQSIGAGGAPTAHAGMMFADFQLARVTAAHGLRVKLQVWDTGRYGAYGHFLPPFLVRGLDALVVCYRAGDATSLADAMDKFRHARKLCDEAGMSPIPRVLLVATGAVGAAARMAASRSFQVRVSAAADEARDSIGMPAATLDADGRTGVGAMDVAQCIADGLEAEVRSFGYAVPAPIPTPPAPARKIWKVVAWVVGVGAAAITVAAALLL
uniref:REM2- and Rab-like small GTPase 1 n=1 Tax=Bicosoecida sp. CB-2014 TaxID=1486930 RepID=A0A7S1C6Q6_9STRA